MWEGLFQDSDTEDQVQIKEEAGKTWVKEANGRGLGPNSQGEASERESEARAGVTGINQVCRARIEARKLEHTKIFVIQAGGCSQLRLFLNRPAFISS